MMALGVPAFGPHLVIQGRGCPVRLLGDPGHVLAFLNFMPKHIRMTPIMPPFVTRTASGVSGIVIIAESHISIHTWPCLGQFALDIFSCKPFNLDRAKSRTLAHFEATGYDLKMFDRGLEYHRTLPLRVIVDRERENLMGQGGRAR